jgi:hypothetical protein
MLLPNERPGAQTSNSDWSYISNARKGTGGIWRSIMQLIPWGGGDVLVCDCPDE